MKNKPQIVRLLQPQKYQQPNSAGRDGRLRSLPFYRIKNVRKKHSWLQYLLMKEEQSDSMNSPCFLIFRVQKRRR